MINFKYKNYAMQRLCFDCLLPEVKKCNKMLNMFNMYIPGLISSWYVFLFFYYKRECSLVFPTKFGLAKHRQQICFILKKDAQSRIVTEFFLYISKINNPI